MAKSSLMSHRRLIVRLKGGLGNQMFEYAAGRALALRNGMELVLDTTSGFIRDKVYHRRFSLGAFPVRAESATVLDQLPFWFEQAYHKYYPRLLSSITHRPWGTFLCETEPKFLDEIDSYALTKNTWMEGYWQSEKYFSGYGDVIGRELAVPEPVEPNFLSMAKVIESCNSVAVGVRVFEDVAEVDKEAVVGGVAPFSFYEEAANRLAERIHDPTFFVFCTTLSAVKDKINLPGQIYYLTTQNGFHDSVQTLSLMSRCRRHIISNSSFYWWGAWLAEHQNQTNIIIASDLFFNKDSIPLRWQLLDLA